jgi:hypothetical protein
MAEPTCATCCYWIADQTAGKISSGNCHRYPPSVSGYTWPVTLSILWCGEWREGKQRAAPVLR